MSSLLESDEELARRLQAELDRADEEQQRQDELLAWQLSQQLQQPPTGPAAPYNDKRHYDNRMVLAEATLTNLDQPSTTNNGQSSPSSTGIPTPLLSSTVLVPTNQSVLATGDTSSKDDTAFLDEDPFGFGPNSIFQLNGETRARELQEQRDLELARQLEEEFKAESRRRQDQGRQHGGSQSNGLGSRGKRQPASSFNSISEADLARPFQSADDIAQCPICGEVFATKEIEAHVNSCLDNTDSPSGSSKPIDQKAVIVNDADPTNKEEFECPICTDTCQVGSGYRFSSCGHSYCGECLGGYYTTNIMNGKVLDIGCPSPGCIYVCTPKDIRFILPDDIYAKYQTFRRTAEANNDPNTKWCPNAGCDTAVKRNPVAAGDPTDNANLLMQCPTCNYEFCFNCAKPFHPGKTCIEAGRWSLFDKDIRVLIWEKIHTKPCPNCNAKIQKRGGCNHITCESCKFAFCWQCLKEYTHDHFEETGCTQYGATPALFYIKTFTHYAVAKIFRRDLWSSDSSSDDEDRLTFRDRLSNIKDDLADRWENTKEDLGEKLDEVKESLSEKFAKFKSLFDK